MFRVIPEKTGVPEGLPEPPGEVLGLSGLEVRERAAARRWRPPPKGSPNRAREGGAAPLSLSLSLSFLLLLVGLRKGNPTPTWGRTPPLGRAPCGRPASSSPPLYTGEGAPHRHTS